MKNIWIAVMGSVVLAACNNQPLRQGGAYDRIDQELKAASEARKSQGREDAIGQAMMPPVKLDEPVVPKAEPRFDLAVNNAPAGQVFMALVSGTRYSMIFPPELSGALTLNLKGVTVREALESIRDLYGYEYKIQGNRITIQPNTVQARIYQINYLASRRQGVSDMRITSSSPSVVNPGGTSSSGTNTTATATAANTTQTAGGMQVSNVDASRVRTSSDNDFWKELKTALETIVGSGEGRGIVINSMSGVVMVKALPSELRAVEKYLKATQLMVERQVMLEAKILEVSLNASFQTGVNWAAFGKKYSIGTAATGASLSGDKAFALAGNAAGGSKVASQVGKSGALATSATGNGFFGLAFQASDFAALISFLETQGDIQVLSSPRIAAVNNQKAVLKVGTDDYYVTNVSTTTTSSGSSTVTSPTITMQPFFSGISLDVTPQIDEEGNILLHIHPAVTVVEEKSKAIALGDMGTYTLPVASSTINESDSIVRVKDGNIAAIGGLMSYEQSNNRQGLPGLSGLPGIGLLFGQKSVVNNKKELVILIKSTILQDDDTMRQEIQETHERVRALEPKRQSWEP